MAEQPFRLKLPSPDARVARTPFADGFALLNAVESVVFVPIVQWGAIRLRGQITGAAGVVNVAFVRPARDPDPATPGQAFIYTAAQPAVDGTAWVDGTEFSLDITAVEHAGENWLRLGLLPGGDCAVDFFDISGILLGLYH